MTASSERPMCEGCKGSGGNWDCYGEGPESCQCIDHTGNEECPECDGLGYYGDPAEVGR